MHTPGSPTPTTIATVYQSSPGARHFLAESERAFEPLEQPDELFPTVFVDVDKTFQTIEGFGGAFTDASADNFAKLSPGAQETFLKACFDPVEGSGYSLCRTTIHSCDYAAAPYSYDDVPGDTALTAFSIEPDRRARIPFIQRALAAARGDLRLYASPWSPPAWMKTNGDMRYGGTLRPEYRQAWADYVVKYVRAYAAEGIPMWGLTVQNEALATQVWESCLFTAAEERDFVRDFLGPTLHRAGLGDLKLMFWDHNRGLAYQRAEVMYDDPEAARYVWGLAFHWYTGQHFDNVRMVHDAWPDKALLYTEAGMGGSWQTAGRLAQNMILDLNNWAAGWTYWNMLLDETNGPRHAGGLGGTNPVQLDTRTGEVTYNPSFHAFAHFSRFIRPGARRIACTSSSDDFLATAAINPDGRVAVVALNQSECSRLVQLWVAGQVIKSEVPAHALTTTVF